MCTRTITVRTPACARAFAGLEVAGIDRCASCPDVECSDALSTSSSCKSKAGGCKPGYVFSTSGSNQADNYCIPQCDAWASGKCSTEYCECPSEDPPTHKKAQETNNGEGCRVRRVHTTLR